MKRYFYIPMTVALLVAVLAVGAEAQTASAQRITARIPFSFTVGKKSLPAGNYTITVVNPTSDRRILQIRSSDGRSSAMIMTTAVIGAAAEDSKLVFELADDQYIFAQAQLAGDSTSLAAVRTKPHRGEKNSVATASKKRLIVIIAG